MGSFPENPPIPLFGFWQRVVFLPNFKPCYFGDRKRVPMQEDDGEKVDPAAIEALKARTTTAAVGR